MKRKFLVFSALFSFFVASTAFAQTSSADSSPQGSWCADKIGNSAYFLEIDANTFTYIDKKSEATVTFPYSESNNVITIFNPTSATLDLDKMDKDFYEHLFTKSNQIAYSRNGEKMVLKLNGKDVKLITREAKASWGKKALGVGAAAVVVVGGTALTVHELNKREKIKNQTEKAYEAAHRMK